MKKYYINKNINSSLELCENALAVSDKFPIKGQGLMEKDLVIQLKELIIRVLSKDIVSSNHNLEDRFNCGEAKIELK